MTTYGVEIIKKYIYGPVTDGRRCWMHTYLYAPDMGRITWPNHMSENESLKCPVLMMTGEENTTEMGESTGSSIYADII